MTDQPNVLFILADQLAPNTLSALGNPHVRTPAMDSIAAAGVSFRRSYCTSPVCTPSRASLATGRMPHVLGVNVNHHIAAGDVPTLGHVLQAAGYETAWVGKSHTPQVSPDQTNRCPGYEYLSLAPHDSRHLGTADDPYVADTAIEFIRQPHAKPFLLGVSLQNPHDICYWIMQRELETLGLDPPEDALPPLPENFNSVDEPEFLRQCRARDHYGNEVQWTEAWDESKWRQYLWVYYRLLERVDAQIARVLAALAETGLAKDTLIVLTSDHGEGLAEHRQVVKLTPYEPATRVPLLVAWPGRTPAGAIDETHLASGLDVLPTICDYAGADIPEGCEGLSLRPVIETPSTPSRDHLILELQPDPERPDFISRIVVTDRHKYIAFSHGATREMLFDLKTDPGETRNLATDPTAQATLLHHRQLLANWVTQTNDPFTIPA